MIQASHLEDFAAPGVTTDLGENSTLAADLPDDPAALAATVRGLVLHNLDVSRIGVDLPSDRMADAELEGANAMARRILQIEPSPFSVPRRPADRMIGFCYHFAVLHCAFLRAKAIPARARCGFASYLVPGYWMDHWIVDYWDGSAWSLIDPNTGRDAVSRDEFVNGGVAWLSCRAGSADPFRHGNGDLWGWDELRGTLISDLAALRKVEVGNWDWCETLRIEHRDQPHENLDARLDPIAQSVADESVAEAQRIFDTSPDLQPPVAR